MKKEIITKEFIKQDIVNGIKNPRKPSKAEYKRFIVPAIIAACLLVVVEFIYPLFILWALLAVFVFLIVSVIIDLLSIKYKAKRVSVDDYEVNSAVVTHYTEESYIAKGPRFNRERIDNFVLHFENGETWNVPKQNYHWSVEYPMSDFAVCQNISRGDVMITVVKKSTGKIAVAYNTEMFVYQEKDEA